MYLRYIGPTHDPDDGRDTLPEGSALPLPQGWEGADHDEPDEATAAEKCASGLYEALIAAEITITRNGRTVRGMVTNITPDPVDVDPTEIPPVDTDGTPGNGGFGTTDTAPFGATPPQEG